MYAWFDLGNGRKVYRKVAEVRGQRSHLACPQIVKPFADPVQSMADGKWYSNPRDLENTYKASGNPKGEEYIALGNEKPVSVEYAPDPVERRNHVKQAMHDVLTGNLPPEIAAIQ
jgi:hypothetical protein